MRGLAHRCTTKARIFSKWRCPRTMTQAMQKARVTADCSPARKFLTAAAALHSTACAPPRPTSRPTETGGAGALDATRAPGDRSRRPAPRLRRRPTHRACGSRTRWRARGRCWPAASCAARRKSTSPGPARRRPARAPATLWPRSMGPHSLPRALPAPGASVKGKCEQDLELMDKGLSARMHLWA
jgi:hypothetical protein